MMKHNPLFAALLVLAASACSRPAEVRSVAAAALPVATNLKTSGQALQSRFAAHRTALDGRAAELAQQAGLARDQANQVELDWKFEGETALPKTLALFREADAQIVADPLAPVAPVTTATNKPAAIDMAPLSQVVSGLNGLRAERRIDAAELSSFFISVNEKINEIESEKSAQKVEEPPQ